VPAAFGGDRVGRGIGDGLTLQCSVAKGWMPRREPDRIRVFHPGTAVVWEELIFEVVGARPLPDGGVEYSLVPWRADLAIRSLERYDMASEAGRAGERKWKAGAIRKRRAAILFSPVLGHLPGAVQERMEREFGAPANWMTTVSALPLLAVGMIGLMGGVVGLAGGSIAPLPEPPFPLAIYLFGESALRLSIVATQSRPAGSLPGTLAYEIAAAVVKTIRRVSVPGS
jgi:hypothetical protein